MSHGLSQAKLVLLAQKTHSQSFTADVFTLATWDSPSVDLGYFTESSDVFTCVIPGTYCVFAPVYPGAAERRFAFRIDKNGSGYRRIGANTAVGLYVGSQQGLCMELAVGDTIAFYPAAISTSTTSLNPSPTPGLQIFFLGGVGSGVGLRSNAPRLKAAVTSASYGAANTKMAFDSPSVNTAQFTESSDVFTCTIPGTYSVYLHHYNTSSLVIQQRSRILKNGSPHAIVGFMERGYTIWWLVELAVGDTIEFDTYQPTTNTLPTSSFYFVELIKL